MITSEYVFIHWDDTRPTPAKLLSTVPLLPQRTAACGQLPRADSSSERTAAWAQVGTVRRLLPASCGGLACLRAGARACAGPRLLHGSPRGGVLRRESFGKTTRRLTSHTDDKEPTLTRTPKFLRSNDNRRGSRWHAAHRRPPQACGHHAAVAAASLLGYSCFALRDDRFNGLWH